jgi:nucleotide-binding universal stress UspA family protein
MQMIRKIMVAVDQSDYSLPLVQYSHQLAQSLGAKMIVVNVYNRRDISAIQHAVNAYDHRLCDSIIKENIEQRNIQLVELVEKAGAKDTVVDKIVKIGVPYQELLEVIEDEKPELLVMGAKGRSNLADTIIGSCAHKMYRRSPIPMLSLRWKELT